MGRLVPGGYDVGFCAVVLPRTALGAMVGSEGKQGSSTEAGFSGRDTRKQAILQVLGIMVMFAAYDAISKFLAHSYPIAESLWVRNVTHLLLIGMFFGPQMRGDLVRTSRPVLQIIRASMLVAVSFLVMGGLRYISLAETTAIVFLTPLLVTAFSAILLKEHVDLRHWCAVSLGFVGVLVIVRPSGAHLNLALAYPLMAAVCYSLYQVLTRKVQGSEHPVTTHFYTGLVGFVVCSLAGHDGWVMPELWPGFLMVCIGLLAGIGHYLLIGVFRHVGPAVVAPFTYTQLAWAVLFGFLVFGEIPDAYSMLGIGIIAASGLYVALRPRAV